MKCEIKSWLDSTILFALETKSLKLTLEAAVQAKVSLYGAYLEGAWWKEYIEQLVPSLCTAGGKTLEEVAIGWECHSWENCPMAIAFSVHWLKQIPILYREEADRFIKFFDAGLIPNPVNKVKDEPNIAR